MKIIIAGDVGEPERYIDIPEEEPLYVPEEPIKTPEREPEREPELVPA